MSWLIDTDLLSERTKPRADSKVLKWLEENAAGIYTSSHVIGELQAGISLLAEGARKRALRAWLNRLVEAVDYGMYSSAPTRIPHPSPAVTNQP